MNSRYLVVLALCGLLMGQEARSANPGLLPLPSTGSVDEAGPGQPKDLAHAQGEVQYLQSSIVLAGEKDAANRVDMDAPPLQVDRPVKVDIVKQGSPTLEGGAENKGPAVEPVVPIAKEITSIGSVDKSVPKRLRNLGDPQPLPPRKGTNGVSRLDASLIPTFIAATATILLLSLAHKRVSMD